MPLEESWDGSQGTGDILLVRNPNQEHGTSSSESSSPSLLPLSNSTWKGVTLRNSHTFGLPQTGHNPGELQLPNLTPCDLHLMRLTEHRVSPDSCPCCKTCLTNWQGQNTAPARTQDQQGSPGHPHWPPGLLGARSPPSSTAKLTKERGSSESQNSSQVGPGEQGVFMELTQGHRAHSTSSSPAPSGDHLSVPTSFPAGITAMPWSSGLWGSPGPPVPSTSPRVPKAVRLCQAKPLAGHITVKQIHKKIINKCKKKKREGNKWLESLAALGARAVAGEGTGWSKVQAQQALGTSQHC